jgi:hypothetical protein
MPKGVKIENDVPGSGREARRGDVVVANLRIFLNRGDEVTAEYPDSPRTVIDLGQRETIAGVRYGIEGMREGGSRTLIVSPHLAYGERGLGEWIPPNAVLRCEVELLEVHDPGHRPVSESAPGKCLAVFHPGLAADSSARWQATLLEDGPRMAIVTRPLPDGSWRRAPSQPVELDCDDATVAELLREAAGMPERYPEQCLANEALWADHAESPNVVTRDRANDTPCVTISILEQGGWLCYYSMKRDSPAWLHSAIRREITGMLASHLGSDRAT